MLVLFLMLPWLAPRVSRVVMVGSDLAALLCAVFWGNMMIGRNTLTNVEALAGMLFLGWFIVFSRQIAAIEADRVSMELIHAQTNVQTNGQEAGRVDMPESRIASDR